MQADQVQSLLQQHLEDCEIHVAGAGSHYDITVIGDVFEGLNAVKKQQLVYAGLNAQIADGSIHAVNIKAFTPAEWAQQN